MMKNILYVYKEDLINMNLYNEELRALRTALEHIEWMEKQAQYKEIKPLLIAKKQQYLKEIKYMIEDL